jgi:ABC-2 type transport system ATP-binding protein
MYFKIPAFGKVFIYLSLQKILKHRFMSLQAKNITKTFGKQKALDNVSFRVESGDIVGFLGPNGAGKSTMMKIITGYLKQSEGEIFVNGLNTKTDIQTIRRQIGYLPEHNPLYTEMYIKEYLRYTAKLYDFSKKLNQRVERSIELTGLGREQHKKIKQLSKGYRQRTGLAAALIHDPDVLILDEPTTGLDPNQIIEIRNLIRNIGKEKTVFLSTHIMQEAEALCNRIIIINKGKIAADRKSGELDFASGKEAQLLVQFEKAPAKTDLLTVEGVIDIKQNKDLFSIQYDPAVNMQKKIFEFAVNRNLVIYTLYKEKDSIENIFRTLTQ